MALKINAMAVLETGAYTFCLATILYLWYALSYFSIKFGWSATAYLSSLKGKGPGDDERCDGFESAGQFVAKAKQPSTAKEYTRNWWTDEKMYQLERRAIFSKTWLFVTHASRFLKAGDYRTFEIAGFSFIVILGKDKQLRAFHNVCRHRAYAVTKKESGSSIVLACRYHGWSYDTKGQLLKAPEFENVEGFDKNLNGLWELKLEVKESMVFVDFDASKVVDKLDLGHAAQSLKRWRVGNMKWVAEWKFEGQFNWKIATDGFPLRLGTDMAPSTWSRLITKFKGSQENLPISPSMKVVRLETGNVLTIRLLPQSKAKTAVECNLYNSGKEPVNSLPMRRELETLKTVIENETKDLEMKQRKLLGGTMKYISGNQDQINELLEAHLDFERKLGIELHPAARKQGFTPEGKDDDDLCKELDTNRQIPGTCVGNQRGDLEW